MTTVQQVALDCLMHRHWWHTKFLADIGLSHIELFRLSSLLAEVELDDAHLGIEVVAFRLRRLVPP